MPSVQTLVKTASIGGIIVAGTGYAFRYRFQQRLRGTKIYKEALDAVYNHEKAVTHLGQPIKEGSVIFGPDKGDIKSFSVILNGSKTRGQLDCDVQIFSDADYPAAIKKLEIKFADIPNRIFVIQNH